MVYDPTAFERRRRANQGGFAAESSVNEYARFLAQTRGTRAQQNFERQVTEQIPQFGRAYGKRGLYGQGIKSGIFNKALGAFGAESARRRADLSEDIAGEQRQYQLKGENLLSAYDRTDKDISEEELIAQTADSLLNLGS
jgi:hypothetical protein